MVFPSLRLPVWTVISCMLLCAPSLRAQSTLEDITALFNAQCTFSGCHNSTSNAGNMTLDGGPSEVYSQLVGQNPTNPQAAGRGLKRVDPGLPHNSYLINKIARNSWDDYYPLQPGEGNPMPATTSLSHEEMELVRQWVLFGAPETGQVVNPAVIADYYAGMAEPEVPRPEAPEAGQGVQMRLGPFFLAPGEEVEYFYKYPLSFDGATEVTRTHVFFNDVSHHFILYRYQSLAQANSYRFGLREIYEPGAAPDLSINMVSAWQDAYDVPLPPGSAYFWDSEEVLDMNFHIYNASPDKVMPCEVYLNVYTRPRDETQPTIEMFSQIIPVDVMAALGGLGQVGESLVIPGDGAQYEFTDNIFFPILSAPTWHLWYLSSHTHSRGVDYDIFDRSTGDQIFEGFYNTDYTFNQGYYDWEHPPVRIFDPLFPINMGITGGLSHTAKYINNTGSTITWGDRTTDEMMLFFIQYTLQPLPAISGIGESTPAALQDIRLFPNPVSGTQSVLSFSLAQAGEVSVEVFDATGRLVAQALPAQWMSTGAHQLPIALPEGQSGLFTAVVRHPQGQYSAKLMKLD